jgi:hypothetical protein
MARLTFLLLVSFFSLSLFAEDPLLVPRRKSGTPGQKKEKAKETAPLETESESSNAAPGLMEWRLGLLAGTVLGNENLYDKRFSTIVMGPTLSIPIMELSNAVALHAETGIRLSLSRLTVSQPAVSFTHFYFFAPILGRVLFQATPDLEIEGIAGIFLRPWQYDSRSTSDGGWQSVEGVSVVEPEIGAGFLYRLSNSTRIQLRASYQFVLAGVEFLL